MRFTSGSSILLRAVPFILRVSIPHILVLEHFLHLIHSIQLRQLFQHVILEALFSRRCTAFFSCLWVDYEDCLARQILLISQSQLALHYVHRQLDEKLWSWCTGGVRETIVANLVHRINFVKISNRRLIGRSSVGRSSGILILVG